MTRYQDLNYNNTDLTQVQVFALLLPCEKL